MLIPLLLAAAALGAPADPFAQCASAIETAPTTRDTVNCIYRVARQTTEYDQALAVVGRLVDAHPGAPWPQLTRLNLQTDMQEVPESEAEYARIAELFDDAGDTRGAVFARLNRSSQLIRLGREDDALAAVADATRVAEEAGDRRLAATTRVQHARTLLRAGRDLEQAYALLKELEPTVFPDGELQTRVVLLHALRDLTMHTGRIDEAIEVGERLRQLAADEGDTYMLGSALYAQLFLVANLPERTEALHHGDLIAFIDKVQLAADASGNPWAAAAARCVSADLLGGEQAVVALEACLEQADDSGAELSDRIFARRQLARLSEPAVAIRLLDEADAIALQDDDPVTRANLLGSRRDLAVRQGDLDAATTAGLQALDRVEQAMSSSDGTDLASQLWWWGSMHYHDLAAAQLETRPGDALTVVERYRGQVLLRRLSDQRTFRATDEDRRQVRVLQDRVDDAREKVWEATDDEARQVALAEIDELRARSSRLQQAIRDRSDRTGLLHIPPATLAAVQQALRPDEAILSYQLAPEIGLRERWNASWAWVITADEIRTVPMPHRADLRDPVKLYSGLFARRDDSTATPSVGLYRQLVEPALDGLPDEVSRLILVPDGPLHGLPFGSLRAKSDAPSLDERFVVTTVPSISLWHHWRDTAEPGWRRATLVLGDPAFDDPDGLGRLPAAADEAQRVLEHVGNASLALGEAASEAWLGALLDENTGIVHLAAHAVVDESFPDRSAVLLAPQLEEDGRLEAHEIASLELDGPLVVLSACRGASGRVVGGEGPLALSRAFFQGGARTVIGSLWPLQDDDALALFDAFYAGIAEGQDVGTALSEAKQARIAAGAPAEAWAGVVVLGDGRLVPLPGGRPSVQTRMPVALLGIGGVGGLVLLLGLGWWWRNRR